METIDLDINNYDLNDIINLFGITNSITDTELKYAKNKMLKIHPDKSGLHPKFFRFYNEAYKMLYLIWEFKQKGNTKNSEYSYQEFDLHKNEMLNKWMKDNNFENKTFNDWFNKEFDNYYIHNEKEEKGYETWLRTSPTENYEDVKDLRTMNYVIDEKKKRLRELSLIQKKEVEDIWNVSKINATNLSPEAPDCYDSDLFSSLSYQDLQKAHTESIIPITIEDYENKQKFENVNEFISFRNNQNIQPMLEGEQYLNEQKRKEEETSIRVAFHLAKQTEQVKQNNELFWKNFQLLNNS
jgi:hypothetical protein